MEENKRNVKVLIILAIIALVAFALGATYAYFTAGVKGNDKASSVNVTTGRLILDFQTSDYISNQKGELLKSSEVSEKADKTVFTVKHAENSTAPATYSLELQDLSISENLQTEDFKWQLSKDDTEGSVASGNFKNVTNGTMTLLSNQKLEVGSEDKYTLRVWLEETEEDQSALFSGTFSGKVALSARNS